MIHRVCQEHGCVTILSRFNYGKFCWVHTPDVGDKLMHIYPRPHTTSEKFIRNIPGTYDITAEDRAEIKRGGMSSQT